MTHRPARLALKALLIVAGVIGALLAGAIATGLISVVVTSGVSMNPVYYQGDLVVIARADSYQVGEIVGYSIPGKNFVALHRITGEDADGFVMKGDNNQSIDPYHPNSSQIVGHAVLHIPQVGRWFQILTSPVALAVAAFALTVFGGTTIRTRRRKKRAAMAQRAPRPNSVTQSVLAMPRNLQIAVAVAGVAGLLGVVLAAVAWTRSSEQIASSSSKESRQMNFSYTAEVPPSPAYDGTTVHSPEPVFRKLTNTVDVHLSYQGVPGTIAVDAELSTPSGWHSTVPLAEPVNFTSDQYLSSVTLDLNSLDERAQAAAAVTGLPASPLTVDVVASVVSADGDHFAPKLTLDLQPLKLSLSGDPTVTDSTTVHDTSLVPNTVGIGPVQLTVIQARLLSTILLVAATATATALFLFARRTPPMSEGAAIRRRYAPLLASVEPMTTPADVPVVDVAEFATLAKLSERCGQLVLHWTRSNIETFVVLDEGTTYRYRTGSGAPTEAVTTPDEAGDAEFIDEGDFPTFGSR